MIQTVLYFALGFLTACLIVMLMAPAVWRRAVVLTRKRIEASVPLTVDEILAAKDRLRAENAMTVRRLEMSVRELRQKVATQLADLGNKGAQLRSAAETIDSKDARIADLEAELEERMVTYREMESDLNEVSQALHEAEVELEERGVRIEEMGHHIEAVSLTSSNRQVDLVARESDVDRLNAEISHMRDERKGLERELAEVRSEAKAANNALKAEQRNLEKLQKKLDAQLSVISDRDERIERRERELERLKERLKDNKARAAEKAKAADEAVAQAEAEAKAAAENEEKARDMVRKEMEARAAAAQPRPQPAGDGDEAPRRAIVDADNAKLAAIIAPLVGELPDGDVDKAARKLQRTISRDRNKIATLEKTVEELQQKIEAEGAKRADSDSTRELREQIRDIAAEMIHITSLLEGEESPIGEIIGAAGDHKGGKASLADKVKALQAAAEKAAQRPADPN